MNEFSNPEPIASPEQFRRALLEVRNQGYVNDTALAMLRAQYNAPAHTITTTQIAKQVGLQNHSAANMQYGAFAHRVADALHYKTKPVESGEPHWWRTLSYGNDDGPQYEDGHYGWIMRPELVQVLETMKWV